jgi:hypothetical protein
LIESIDRLRQEVEVLREAVDELRMEVQYLVRNPSERRDPEPVERPRATIAPLELAANDFGQQVNAVPGKIAAESRTAAVIAQERKLGPATTQRGLFRGRKTAPFACQFNWSVAVYVANGQGAVLAVTFRF